jgi:hypothetical protein
MRPSDKIEKLFTQTHVKTNSDVDKVVLDVQIKTKDTGL